MSGTYDHKCSFKSNRKVFYLAWFPCYVAKGSTLHPYGPKDPISRDKDNDPYIMFIGLKLNSDVQNRDHNWGGNIEIVAIGEDTIDVDGGRRMCLWGGEVEAGGNE